MRAYDLTGTGRSTAPPPTIHLQLKSLAFTPSAAFHHALDRGYAPAAATSRQQGNLVEANQKQHNCQAEEFSRTRITLEQNQHLKLRGG